MSKFETWCKARKWDPKTAIRSYDEVYRMNLRRRRAEALVAEVMNRIDPFIDREAEKRDVYRALMGMFVDKGVEVVTDYTRQEAGLPPRSEDGWTADELRALETKRLEVLTRPLAMPIFPLAPLNKL